jgi:hypothetical protein
MTRFFTAFLGAIILFVVVCPLTPTPIAVLNGKTAAAHTPILSIAISAVLPAPTLEAVEWATVFERTPIVTGGSVLDQTCSRLC